MEDFNLNLINAKYHLSVAKRLHSSFFDYREKRFLVGVINELSKASYNLIRAYLIFERALGRKDKKNIEVFMKEVGPRYLDREILVNIFKTLEIERAQKTSRVEFARGDKIILLVEGKYRFLTSERLKEFIDSVEIGVGSFPTSIKR